MSAIQNNLIQNGDFEQGITGFSSEYAIFPNFNPVCSNFTYGVIAISTNPAIIDAQWCNMPDHTQGAGVCC
jgi:hypothetical protein